MAALAWLSAPDVPGRAQNTPSTDEAIKTRIESSLLDEGLMGVHVDVHQRTVTLSGSIESLSMTIYNHPMFAQYALQPVGPIHIIVRRAHVTLTGVVASEADRRVAEMLTRGVGGVMGVKNALRLAEKSDPAT